MRPICLSTRSSAEARARCLRANSARKGHQNGPQNRTAGRDKDRGAAQRNGTVRGHVARARAPAALARPTPPPTALRRRGLRGFECKTGSGAGMGRQRAGEERPRRRTKSQAPSARKLKPRWPFSRAREAISGPILRTRFWSRKRDHAADARRPQMTIPCMTCSQKNPLGTARVVARGPVFGTTRWS